MFRYEESVLKDLQSAELSVLKKFVSVCDKYNIGYFMIFGSAIGAVRHGGFIPWDDDIDVGMLRTDYERLKQVPEEEWGDEYLLSDALDNCDAHTLIYPQIYKKGTVFQTEYHYKYDKNSEKEKLPIWLDILLYDRLNDKNIATKKAKRAHILRKLFYYSKCGIRVRPEDGWKMKLMCAAKNFLHLICYGKAEKIYKAYIKLISGNTGDYITTYDTSVLKEITNSVIHISDVFPTISVPFENMTVQVANNYDKMLRNIYGNYMEMPPEEKRINHPPYFLDFGDGRGNVIVDEK